MAQQQLIRQQPEQYRDSPVFDHQHRLKLLLGSLGKQQGQSDRQQSAQHQSTARCIVRRASQQIKKLPQLNRAVLRQSYLQPDSKARTSVKTHLGALQYPTKYNLQASNKKGNPVQILVAQTSPILDSLTQKRFEHA